MKGYLKSIIDIVDLGKLEVELLEEIKKVELMLQDKILCKMKLQPEI